MVGGDPTGVIDGTGRDSGGHDRRHALVALAILSAVITPPDVFSMILVLLPLFGLYEYSNRISERTLRRSSGTEGTTTEGK